MHAYYIAFTKHVVCQKYETTSCCINKHNKICIMTAKYCKTCLKRQPLGATAGALKTQVNVLVL